MQDKTLLRFALFGSIIGVGILFLFSISMELEEKNINHLDDISDGKKVRITGHIKRITTTESMTHIDLLQECEIHGVLFDKADLKEGDEITLIGDLASYQGEKEIIVDKIEKR